MKENSMINDIYVNLAVKDLSKSITFFEALGFEFNNQFTDSNGACLILGKNIYAMLLSENFFKSFIPGRKLVDAFRTTESLLAISTDSRQAVDTFIEKVNSAGGKEYRETQDYEWMYSRAFQDLDGHIWEVVYMDESKFPKK